MNMHNPPHPGEFIKNTYLAPFNVSQNEMADKLGVARSTFNRLIRKIHAVSPEMAIRLSKVIGRTPESWLKMQACYDLYQIEQTQNQLTKLKKFKFDLRKRKQHIFA